MSTNNLVWAFLTSLLLLVSISCIHIQEKDKIKSLLVTATAYNDVHWQTTAINSSITAWGDTLKEGMKVIAISRDLLDSGLTYNTPVYIPALDDTYYVMDKMHSRWRNKIDIYMGKDVKRAKEWGRRKIYINWVKE